MVAIKNFEKPNACYQCELLDEHGVCSITGDDIFADCPLVEIEERKVGKWEHDKLFGECAYVCPFCHTIWTSSEIQSMHYCPTCSAEMVGVENE